jgi:hypothetical protein
MRPVTSVDCEIVRWTDDHFPGWVEARLVDADGREWRFEDKAPMFSAELLTPTTSYPVAGAIRCEVVGEDRALGRITIETSSPDGITAVDGVTTRFSVLSSVVGG